jgi:N-acyl-D-aspartate/D-glutamate deacylase
MRAIVRDALDAGAMGFSTSRHTGHVGAGGQPVPSRLAEWDEVDALTEVLGEAGKGLVQLTAGGAVSFDDLLALSQRIGRPVTNSALVTGTMPPGQALQLADHVAEAPGELWPQITCRPIVTQLTLEQPYMLARIPAFTEVLAAPVAERSRIYADPAWRRHAEPDVTRWAEGRWDRVTVQETVRHGDARNRPLTELAAERATTPFDVFLDLAIEDGLATRFQFVRLNDDRVELAQLLRKPHTVLGLSDAGAHGDSLCDACFTTSLLGEWVREEHALTLEAAVWRLSGQPATLLGLPDRGLVREGYVADLVAFDPATVASGELERVWDLPGGANRLIARGAGIEHVWVGGTAIRRDGADLPGARPGVVLRG